MTEPATRVTEKCRNAACQQRGQCWRYIAPSFKAHVYKPFAPGPGGECKDFLPLLWKRRLDAEAKPAHS